MSDETVTLSDLIASGSPIGDVWPPRPPRPLADKDAREYALERLALFISLFVFRKTSGEGEPPIGFRYPLDRIHVYQPDDLRNVKFPAIAFLPGRGMHEPQGLGPAEPLEETQDVYGQGTVIVKRSDYVETFTVEVLAPKHAERRGTIAGLKQAFAGTEAPLYTDLKLPAYYDQVARFWLDSSMYVDDAAETAKNRRRGHLYLNLTVPEVFLADYVTLEPIVDLGGRDATLVYDGNLWLDYGETSVSEATVRGRCSEEYEGD